MFQHYAMAQERPRSRSLPQLAERAAARPPGVAHVARPRAPSLPARVGARAQPLPAVATTTVSGAESGFTILGHNIEFKQTVSHSDETILDVCRVFEARYLGDPDCDVVIECGGMSMQAHKELLVERIPYFSCIFSHEFVESSTGVVSLSTQFSQIDSTSIRSLIGYCYDGLITITEDNVNSLLATAIYLQMDTIVDECAMFLYKRVRCDSALSLLAHFRSLSIHNENLWRFIQMNFVPVSRCSSFTEMSCEEVVELLQRDSLRIDCEEQVLEAVNRWVAVGRERWSDGARLLKQVRLTSLRHSSITDSLVCMDWVKENPECLSQLEDLESGGRRRDRFAIDAPKIVCGFRTDDDGGVYIFNPTTGVCTEVETSWKPENYTPAVPHGSKVYFPNEETTRVLDVETGEWSELAAMPDRRHDASVAIIDDVLFVAGGHDGNRNATSSLIALDLRDVNPQWKELAPMSTTRWQAASCSYNGRLYVFGGSDTVDFAGYCEILDSCESYEPKTNEWTRVSSLRRATSAASAIAVLDRIFLLGGLFDVDAEPATRFLDTFDEFDTLTDTWRRLPNFPSPIWTTFMFHSNGKLFVCTDSDSASEMQVYDYVKGVWTAPLSTPPNYYDWTDSICSLSIPATIALPTTAFENH